MKHCALLTLTIFLLTPSAFALSPDPEIVIPTIEEEPKETTKNVDIAKEKGSIPPEKEPKIKIPDLPVYDEKLYGNKNTHTTRSKKAKIKDMYRSSDEVSEVPKKYYKNRKGKKVYTDITYIGENLSSNRGRGIESKTIQIATFYDGSGSANLELEFKKNSEKKWIELPPQKNFAEKINSFEYRTGGWVPTGCFKVSDVKKNGVIDGLGFGALYKRSGNSYKLFKSRSLSEGGLEYVGAWPLGLWDRKISELTRQVEKSISREQIKIMLYGSELVDNGTYCIEGY